MAAATGIFQITLFFIFLQPAILYNVKSTLVTYWPLDGFCRQREGMPPLPPPIDAVPRSPLCLGSQLSNMTVAPGCDRAGPGTVCSSSISMTLRGRKQRQEVTSSSGRRKPFPPLESRDQCVCFFVFSLLLFRVLEISGVF